jgi:hypothetical protein
MRILSLRLIVALIVGITLVSVGLSWYDVRADKDGLRRDLERKAATLGESLAGNAESYLQTGNRGGVQQMAQQFTNRDHLLGIGVYSENGSPIAVTRSLDSILSSPPRLLHDTMTSNQPKSNFMLLSKRRMYVLAAPLHDVDKNVAGGIVVVHDATYIRREIFRIWGRVFIHIAIQGLLIVAITLLIVRWSLAGPIARLAQWMKALRTGKNAVQPSDGDLDFLLPLAREVAPLAESMQQARAAAEMEARLRNTNESVWTAQSGTIRPYQARQRNNGRRTCERLGHCD